MKFSEGLKWKVYFFWLKVRLARHEVIDKHMRRKYCHKGYHKVYQSYYGHGESSKVEYVYYIGCRHCNYHFFATKEDKELYIKLHEKAKGNASDFLNLFSSGKLEAPIKPSVRD